MADFKLEAVWCDPDQEGKPITLGNHPSALTTPYYYQWLKEQNQYDGLLDGTRNKRS
jgi:hypothetical protein